MNYEDEPFTYEQIVSIASSIPHIRNRTLFILEFLTGGRVNEILKKVRRKDFVVSVAENGNHYLYVNNFFTEKNPNHPRRSLPIPVDKENQLIIMLDQFLGTLEQEQPLFSFSAVRAWQIISPIVMKHKARSFTNSFLNANHFMRHCRNTDLVVRYHYNAFQLMQWNGWSSIKPADRYVHLNTTNLENQMI